MIRDRYISADIAADLAEKMVFVGGPRQVGKTTCAREIGRRSFESHAYLNWDNRDDRKSLMSNLLPAAADLLVLDEIHKYRQWKNLVKGFFDSHGEKYRILVTGSARLDVYRRGGDSLMGRYHYYRLHPFSVAEALCRRPDFNPAEEPSISGVSGSRDAFQQLLTFGGFPEPFLRQNSRTLRRWHNQRLERLVQEDIRDTESIRDIQSLLVLADILPSKVASLLSLNSLREDLNVAHKTVSAWMDVLERFYYHFRIYPFAGSAIKSLRKEPKLYLWDWSEVPDKGARLENLVASHLLKYCHFLHDAEGYKAELFFLRDVEGREVDFLVTLDKKPWFAVEVKASGRDLSGSLGYFMKKLNIPWGYQVTGDPDIDLVQKGMRLVSAENFLAALV